MSVIPEKKQHPGQKAIEANPHKDGPHDPKIKSKANKANQKSSESEPAYVVSVEARPQEEGSKKSKVFYSPEEVRAKAKAFLNSNQLTAEERKVLAEILSDKKES